MTAPRFRVAALALFAFAWAVSDRAYSKAEPGEKLTEFLEDHCIACHRGRRAKGEFDLTSAKIDWRRVRTVLERRTMPPDSEDPPTEQAYREALSGLAAMRAAERRAPPPAVVIRRLNRAEYENTIHDLLGVDFDASAYFPADEVGYGFDNVGDVLSLPPALLEKYLDAAERIAEAAIVDEGPPKPRLMSYRGHGLRIEGGGNRSGLVAYFFANGEAWATHEFPRAGEYEFIVEAWGQQAGPEPVRLALRVDRRNVESIVVKETAEKAGEFRFRRKVRAGSRRVGVAFVNDYYRPRHPDPKQRDRNAAIVSLTIRGPLDREPLPPSQRRILPKPPSRRSGSAKKEAFEAIRHFAAKAWRCTVGGAYMKRLWPAVGRASPKDATTEQLVRTGIVAVLTSPKFLFRVEKPGPKGVRTRDPWELASRLSYFLWSSTPDDELFARARAGDLAQPQVLDAQVTRMLRDARASSLASRFASQWLQIGQVDSATPDPAAFPSFDNELRSAMRAETEMVFEALLREKRSIWELVRSDFTFLNEKLAKLYGVPGVRGKRMRRVALTSGRRGGVLTHASVLTATSNPTRTSPVKRGKWILEVLLDAPPPPPPPGADDIDESPEAVAAATFKERLEQHRADPACAQCHTRMDTLGFALEHYDAIGRWRDRDGKHPIDAGGELPDGSTIHGAVDLAKIVHGDEGFLRSLSKNMLVFALGRGLLERDEPAVESLVKSLKGKPTLDALIREIVQLDAFRGVSGATKR